MSSGNVRVVLIARQAIARAGMRHLLTDAGFNVIAALTDQLDSSDPFFEIPDLIVIQSETADEGIAIVGMMRLAVPGARLILITPLCDLSSISRAFASGVDGYLTNAIPCEAMIGALRLVMMGEKMVPTEFVSEMVSTSFPSQPHIWGPSSVSTNLSDCETDVLKQLVLGEANKVISRHFSISEATVKVHVKAILRKLRVMNRTQAAIWAVNNGIAASTNEVCAAT